MISKFMHYIYVSLTNERTVKVYEFRAHYEIAHEKTFKYKKATYMKKYFCH